jgi:hypothetical protein
MEYSPHITYQGNKYVEWTVKSSRIINCVNVDSVSSVSEALFPSSWFGVITDDMINHLRRLNCILLPWELQIIYVQWSSWVYESEAFALLTLKVTVCGTWWCLQDTYWHLEGRYWVFFLGWHILWIWTWRQYTLTRLHGITCQKIVPFINIILIGLGIKSTYAEKTCKLLVVCVREGMREEWGGG